MLGLAAPPAAGWRSAFYPEDWTPGYADPQGRFLHDFSYAGYHAGARSISPLPPGRVYDVTAPPYGADPTGGLDATAAIQRAIDNAQDGGGGVVSLPPGVSRISPRADRPYALRINRSGVVLRGAGSEASRLFLATSSVRGKGTMKVAADDERTPEATICSRTASSSSAAATSPWRTPTCAGPRTVGAVATATPTATRETIT